MNVTTTDPKARKKSTKWTEEMKEAVRQEYPLGDKLRLAERLGVSRKAIKHIAGKLGVRSLQDKNLYQLKPLYEDSMLSCYWMGFVMADGHISQKGQLSISLSSKDREHLRKLSTFLNVNLHDYEAKMYYSDDVKSYSRLTCQDAVYGKKLLGKFGLSGAPKTCNPPESLVFSEARYFLAFLIGFIDGDGSMNRDANNREKVSCIKLEMHGSWKQTLEGIRYRLTELNVGKASVSLSKRGYAALRIYKQKNFRYLKRFSMHHGLPVLGRKWDLIDENDKTDRVKTNDLPLDCEDFHDSPLPPQRRQAPPEQAIL